MNGPGVCYRILSIDAWRDGPGWTWNAWYRVGSIPAENLPKTHRAILALMRRENYLSSASTGRVAVEDDGYNVVIMARGTREPLFAIEYGIQS